MYVTAKMLRDLGVANVITFPQPCIMVNGGSVAVKYLRYESLREIQLAHWFTDNTVLMIYEVEADFDDNYEGLTVCLFNFTNWNESLGEEDKYSPLSLYRAKNAGSLKAI